MIPNGSFETNDFWSVVQGARYTGTRVYEGVRSMELRVRQGNPSPDSAVIQGIDVLENETHTYQLYPRGSAPAGLEGDFKFTFEGRDKLILPIEALIANEWNEFTVVFDDIDAAAPPGSSLSLQTVRRFPAAPGFSNFGLYLDAIVEVVEDNVIAETLRDYIATQGFGTVGDDLFLSHLPDDPDNAICVYDESAPTLDESQALALDRFGVQFTVRNTDYGTARDTSVNIHKKILGLSGVVIAGTPEIVMVEPVTPPTSLGRDEKRRVKWTSHYYVLVVSTGDQFRS